jgi:hypothetical protein
MVAGSEQREHEDFVGVLLGNDRHDVMFLSFLVDSRGLSLDFDALVPVVGCEIHPGNVFSLYCLHTSVARFSQSDVAIVIHSGHVQIQPLIIPEMAQNTAFGMPFVVPFALVLYIGESYQCAPRYANRAHVHFTPHMWLFTVILGYLYCEA